MIQIELFNEFGLLGRNLRRSSEIIFPFKVLFLGKKLVIMLLWRVYCDNLLTFK